MVLITDIDLLHNHTLVIKLLCTIRQSLIGRLLEPCISLTVAEVHFVHATCAFIVKYPLTVWKYHKIDMLNVSENMISVICTQTEHTQS